MQIRRYEAKTMRDGLEQVKSDLGAEAIILSAKNLKPGQGSRGVRGPMVEIIAAQERVENPGEQPKEDRSPEFAPQFEPLRRDIRDLKDTVSRLAYPRISLPPSFDRIFQELVFQGVREEVALRLTLDTMEELNRSADAKPRDRKSLIASVIRRFPLTRPFAQEHSAGQQVVALVGPTGVGKTTTLAKIAAHFALKIQKKVAILTGDSYRIAAAEQLSVFGKIMNLPVDVVENRQEIVHALRRLKEMDLILIDTAGQSHRDKYRIHELNRLLRDLPITKHLVLSCTTRERDLEHIVERFRCLGLDRLLFTKLDEAATFGTILNLAYSTGLPLSYLTIGQKVPEDIREATPDILASLVFSTTTRQKTGTEVLGERRWVAPEAEKK
jgi:flagellar biosynthesis protein FlhF